MTIADRIRIKRNELNLSQTELAKKAGYSDKTAISKFEHAGDDISMKQIKRVAEALGTTSAYLMGWDEEDNPTIEEMKRAVKIRELYATAPSEILDGSRTDKQVQELISLFLNGDEADRETYLRILRGLQQKP